MESKDSLGDRLKAVEQVEAGRKAVVGKPLMARLDGRAFHTFTKGLNRPYDLRLSTLMYGTTAALLEQTHALVGYTQSDEITLCWYESGRDAGQYLFDGKFQKLTSVLASIATAYFVKNLSSIPEKEHLLPTFDCRVWQPETMEDAYLNFLWRQDDAIKNSISMAAQAEFSHKALHGVGSAAKKEMLADAGVPWEDNPQFFKSGTFVQRTNRCVELSAEELAKIPEQFRPKGPVIRSFIEDVNIGELRRYKDPHIRLFGLYDSPYEPPVEKKSIIERIVEVLT